MSNVASALVATVILASSTLSAFSEELRGYGAIGRGGGHRPARNQNRPPRNCAKESLGPPSKCRDAEGDEMLYLFWHTTSV